MAVVRIFALQKVPTDPTLWGVVSQGTIGAGNSATQKFPPAGGEISPFGGELAQRFADLEQILFFFGQTLRSRFAAEKNSVKRNFAKPLLLSLRLHAQRKSE